VWTFHCGHANVGFQDIPALVSGLVKHPAPFKPFLPLLSTTSKTEDTTPMLTSIFLTSLISKSYTVSSKEIPALNEVLPKLYAYLSNYAKDAGSVYRDDVVQQYSALLRGKKARVLFWKQREETVNPLMDILRAAAGATSSDGASTLWSGGASIRSGPEGGIAGGVGLQLLYHVLLVIWQLSFEGDLVGEGLNE
jgi:V-type H+-transporting ATPase subunit H